MIDSLCHLELIPRGERERALADARAAGVTMWISAGTDPLTDESVGADAGAGVHRAFGIHPEFIGDVDAQLRALDQKLAGAIAIGECGLDLRESMPPLDVQMRVLEAQLELAARRDLPVILHVVRAHSKLWPILDAHPVRGVWHGFAGPQEALREAAKRGLFISIGALVLNARARKLREAIGAVPLDRLLVETDAPDIPLATLLDVTREVARLRGETFEHVAAATIENACRVYRLRGHPREQHDDHQQPAQQFPEASCSRHNRS